MSERGLFVDFDGTLADSLPIMREIHAQLAKRWRCRGEGLEFSRLHGLPLAAVVEIMARDAIVEVEREHAVEEYRRRIAAAYPQVQPAPGARRALALAGELGYEIAVVSSAPDTFIKDWLRSNGMAELVTNVIGGDSVEKGKPDPEPYQLALDATGTAAELSIAVEDSMLGLQSALAAGLKTYAITHDDSPAIDMPGAAGQLAGFAELEEVLNATDG